MTREEFEEEVADIYGLCCFCIEHEYDDHIVSADDIDSIICDSVGDFLRNNFWYELKRKLNNIEDGFDFYYMEDAFDYTPITGGNYDDMYADVLEWAIDCGIVEDDEEHEQEAGLSLDDTITIFPDDTTEHPDEFEMGCTLQELICTA